MNSLPKSNLATFDFLRRADASPRLDGSGLIPCFPAASFIDFVGSILFSIPHNPDPKATDIARYGFESADANLYSTR